MEEENYFFCDYCKRYYLNMFRGHHDKQHKYMISKHYHNFDDTY